MVKPTRGFTLIELMIVVAIIGILATLAIPSYQDYTRRAKVGEAVLAASQCRTSISEVYQSSSEPMPPGKWGCEVEDSSQYVESIKTDEIGTIMMTIRGIHPSANGKILALSPIKTGGVIMTASDFGTRIFGWTCLTPKTTLEEKYLPSSCK